MVRFVFQNTSDGHGESLKFREPGQKILGTEASCLLSCSTVMLSAGPWHVLERAPSFFGFILLSCYLSFCFIFLSIEGTWIFL